MGRRHAARVRVSTKAGLIAACLRSSRRAAIIETGADSRAASAVGRRGVPSVSAGQGAVRHARERRETERGCVRMHGTKTSAEVAYGRPGPLQARAGESARTDHRRDVRSNPLEERSRHATLRTKRQRSLMVPENLRLLGGGSVDDDWTDRVDTGGRRGTERHGRSKQASSRQKAANLNHSRGAYRSSPSCVFAPPPGTGAA